MRHENYVKISETANKYECDNQIGTTQTMCRCSLVLFGAGLAGAHHRCSTETDTQYTQRYSFDDVRKLVSFLSHLVFISSSLFLIAKIIF